MVEVEPLTISVEVAAAMLGIGRSLAYQEARAGRLPGLIHIGSRLVVSKQRLMAFINGADGQASNSNGDGPESEGYK